MKTAGFSSFAQDFALGAIVAVVDVLVFSNIGTPVADSISAWEIVGIASVGPVVLTWRRRAPLIVFTILWIHSMVGTQLPRYQPVLFLLVALYTVAATCPMRVARLVLPIAYVPNVFLAVTEATTGRAWNPFVLLGILVFYGLMTGGTWGTGRWVYVSRLRTADLEYRRKIEAREAVALERIRIARDLHDVVAHAVTVMMLQASGAQRVMTSNREQANQALVQVTNLGQQAMVELRRLLVVLRAEEGDEGGLVGVDHQLGYGLADLDDLLERMRQAGVPVQLTVTGVPRLLDHSVDLTAYRVIQEALTNVTKYAGPGIRTVVTLSWSEGLEIRIENDGGGRPMDNIKSLSTGHGLIGLRERVVVVGGLLKSGSTRGGGFCVIATLPIRTALADSRGSDHDKLDVEQ